MKTLPAMLCLCSAALALRASDAQTISVVGGPHDLSAGNIGAIRAATEDQVCIFCHTPHNASPVGALWNRSLSPQAYTVYTSRALDAVPGQPTGSSKLCLSCHDGTIALGNILSRNLPIQMSGGITTLPPGKSNLGTDLRDDHPISFAFDSTLSARDGSLRDPGGLPHEIRLDVNRELQCTACHNAHNNAFGKFLVMRNTNSELCISCHQISRTDISGHGQCADCHQPHSAPSGPFLLRQPTVSQTCLGCHDGQTPGAANIAAEMNRAYAHEWSGTGEPSNDPGSSTNCTSCHDPHTMMAGIASAPRTHAGPTTGSVGRLGRIQGVSAAGSPVKFANAEEEVCFKCHGDNSKLPVRTPRWQGVSNVRQQFNPSAISRHPVGTPARTTQSPSLLPGWTSGSTLRCSDCHGSDNSSIAGVHGSNVQSILSERYETADYTSESASAYALCYKCHDRASILDDRSFPGHRRHIVDEQTSCSTCHDAHGIAATRGKPSANSHLINFATSIVLPDRVTGRLEYRDTGGFTGECFLSCHGVDHSPKRYPTTPGMGFPEAPAQRSRTPR
ncbi:MAG: hypothetical protein JNK58_12085 [Phycisphaerae bacterium]|nr:hypothetical protein [Phycisphaerae bacterium]